MNKLLKNIHKHTQQNRNSVLIMASWLLLNILLLIKSLHQYSAEHRFFHLFPFNSSSNYKLWAYDYSEFILYAILLPIIITLIWKYFYHNVRNVINIFVLWCLCFSIVAFVDNSSINELFLYILKAIFIFLIFYYSTSFLVGSIINKH